MILEKYTVKYLRNNRTPGLKWFYLSVYAGRIIREMLQNSNNFILFLQLYWKLGTILK